MKFYNHFKQISLVICVAALLFGGAACGNQAPAQPPENVQAPSDAPQPENIQAPSEGTPQSENAQAPSDAIPQPEGGQNSASAAQTPENVQAPADTNPPDQPQAPAGSQSQISMDAAKSAALAHAGLDASAVTYTKEKLDYEDGIAVYEIEFYTSTLEYEYEINAATGEIYSVSSETFDGHSDHSHHIGGNENASNAGSDIGIESAKSIALEHAGFSASDVTFKKAKADTEDGRAVYEVEFYKDAREYEYTILASDGTILEYDID